MLLRISFLVTLFVLAALSGASDTARAQDGPIMKPKSGAAAFGLSLLVPGLGHRYVNDGRWGGVGTAFLAADLTLWAGLISTIGSENNAVDAYTNVVATRSGNTLDGKNRAFELALGSYDSSQDYIDALLRSRQWDRLENAEDPANQWDWQTEEDRRLYVDLREDADAAGNRKTALIGALVVNRLLSGVTAALSSRKTRATEPPSLSVGAGYHPQSSLPTAHAVVRF